MAKAIDKKVTKKPKRRSVVEGCVYVQATSNNTIITVTDNGGDVISWSSAGSSGFKGARKATPYAAQVAAENALNKAKVYGLDKVCVYVKGIGNGRDQAIRGVHSSGVTITTITDVTPIPHNGCRKKKARRV